MVNDLPVPVDPLLRRGRGLETLNRISLANDHKFSSILFEAL
jgi:hypothetical protein